MAKGKNKKEDQPLWGSGGKYKPTMQGSQGPIFGGTKNRPLLINDLISSIKSERRGFENVVTISKKQSKRFSDLVERAKAEGVEVNVLGKKAYKNREFDLSSTGTTNVRGGFANSPRGQAAQAKFEALGGQVLAPRTNKKGVAKAGNIVAPPKSTQVAGDRTTFARYYGVYSAPGKPRNRGRRFRRG
jgi:hypothetical protein